MSLLKVIQIQISLSALYNELYHTATHLLLQWTEVLLYFQINPVTPNYVVFEKGPPGLKVTCMLFEQDFVIYWQVVVLVAKFENFPDNFALYQKYSKHFFRENEENQDVMVEAVGQVIR